MRFTIFMILTMAFAPGAGAQDRSRPLEVTVRPSGVENPEEEARLRQERLEARMRRDEFLFRSICRACSASDRFESNAPFNPQEALRGSQ